jgi:hypothetical protein
MNDLLVTLLGAVLGIVAMPIGLYLLPTVRLLSPLDQARAFGSFLTRSEANALKPGIVSAVFFGLLWAFVYAGLWSLFDGKTLGFYIVLGAVSGAFFGENLSLTTVLVFTDNHPVARFQDKSWQIALGTVMVHLVHGIVFGVVAGLFALGYDFIPKMVYVAP